MGCGTQKSSVINPTVQNKNAPLSNNNKALSSVDNKGVFISQGTGDIHTHYDFGKVLGKGTVIIRLIWAGHPRHSQGH
jgi:hypothetical protein